MKATIEQIADRANQLSGSMSHGADIEDIEAGAFERSGTGVKTRMIVATKN